MAYSLILGNNTKWVSSELSRCGRAYLGLLGRGYVHHVILITELLLVWHAGYMDPHYQIGSLNLAKCPELATYQLECEALTYRAIGNTLYCMWQIDRGMGRDLWRTCKRGSLILK